jgi:hypothetical protein
VVGEDLVKVAVAEEEAAPEPAVGLVAGDLFEALKEGIVDEGGVPFPGELLGHGAAAEEDRAARLTCRWPRS